ncbi:MAG TPA: RDD family protein, partial [Vicinamibacterales bacterium]|nr:RDD family protein [Vicinamibacterales bacterium]
RPASSRAPRVTTPAAAPARAAAAAGAVQAPPPPPAPVVPDVPDEIVEYRRVRPILRIGQDFTVRQNETVSDIVLVSGVLRIEGRVRGDVVVIAGAVHAASTAQVDGDFVNIGGGVTVEPGAHVRGDLVTVGGALSAPAEFSPGGEQVVVGSTEIGNYVQGVIPWVTHGLMLGRVIVPSLGWIWIVAAISLGIAIVLGLVFESPVRACAEAITAKPLTTFLMGLLVLLLLGPLSFVLAVSIVGIIVLPFLFFALVIAWVLGKIAVARWIGWSVLPESEPGDRLQAVRSIAIGTLIITPIYMLPLLGLATWVILGVLGLGSATSSLFKALRRENPVPPKPPAPPQPIGPDTTPSMPPIAPVAGVAASYAPGVDSSAGPAFEGAMPAAAAAATSAPPRPVDVSDAGLLSLPRATFTQRVAAGALDVLLVLIVYQTMDPHSSELFWYLTLLTIYNAAFWTWRGTTIGGIICQLRVVRTDGRRMEFGDAAIRGLSSVFSLLVLGLGFFWILLSGNTDRQAWHDLIAGTIVVRVPKSTPLR